MASSRTACSNLLFDFSACFDNHFLDALLQMDHAAMASGRLIGRGTRGPLAARAIEPTEQS
jgi:hypothetical protein